MKLHFLNLYARLPDESFPNIKNYAREMFLKISSTDSWDFKKWNTSYPSVELSYEYLKTTLLIRTTMFDAIYRHILQEN